MLSTSCLSVLFISTLSAISASNSPSSIRNKRICRSCGELAKEVDKRMEETAANPRIIQVAARIGADGRPIPGRKIDYMTSDARFFDIFDDEICDAKMDYSSKSACYLIRNDYEEELKEWFKGQPKESFLDSFCYKKLPECNKEVYEASLTDIELENYEEDKDKIDDDFMPEAKEENVINENENFAKEAVEKVKDLRDNFLDLFDALDGRARQFLLNSLLENEKIRPYLNKFLTQEHFDILLNYWYLSVLSLLISILLPIFFLISLSKKSGQVQMSANARKSTKKLKVPKIKTTESTEQAAVTKEFVSNTSESEAAEADDENEKLIQTKGLRKSTRASKRNSKSQADN